MVASDKVDTEAPESSLPAEYPYSPQPATIVPGKPAAERRGPGMEWWLLLGILGVSLAADLLVVPLMDVFNSRDWGAVWVYACAGVIVAQGGILTVWLTWGAENYWFRLLAHWSLAGICLATWLVGVLGAEGEGDFWEALQVVGPALPLISLSAQAPLWVMRYCFGWSLVRNEPSPATARPLSIGDLLIATWIAGLSLAAARWVDGGRSLNAEFWGGWAIAVAIATGFSIVALLPAASWLLGMRQAYVAAALTGIYAIGALAVVWAVFVFIVWGPRPSAWDLTGFSIVVLTFAATLSIAAIAARGLGYVLKFGLRREAIRQMPVV
jgi:hypothetical protein